MTQSDALSFTDVFGEEGVEEPQEIELTEELYDLPDTKFVIRSPCSVFSEVNSVFRCQRIIVLSKDVSFRGIRFEGSFICRNALNFRAKNVDFSHGNVGSGGSIVVTRSLNAVVTDCVFHDSLTSGIFVETQSTLVVSNVKMQGLKQQNICISNISSAKISNCEFSDSDGIPLVCLIESEMLVESTYIHDIKSLAMNLSSSSVTLNKVRIYNVDQNGINVFHCNYLLIKGCFFYNTFSSSISLVSQKNQIQIINNSFVNIHGNAVIMTDESNAIIANNVIDKIDYPSVAVLTKSKVLIQKNIIKNCMKAGICARGAKKVQVMDNSIQKVADTGISVSDCSNITIWKNNISFCSVAAIESYNESVVVAEENVFTNPGKTALLCYAGATLNAKKNTVINPNEALVLLSTHGGGDFIKNTCSNCSKQYIGETTGQIYMKDNSDFENITNDEQRANDKIQLIPPFNDPKAGKCLKCGIVERFGFLVPCGHKIFCQKCGEEAAGKNECCPLCRFPIQGFTSGYSNSNDNKCSICLENEADAVVLPCGHTGFCASCLASWLAENNTCPVCRKENVIIKKIISNF